MTSLLQLQITCVVLPEFFLCVTPTLCQLEVLGVTASLRLA